MSIDFKLLKMDQSHWQRRKAVFEYFFLHFQLNLHCNGQSIIIIDWQSIGNGQSCAAETNSELSCRPKNVQTGKNGK